MKFILPFILLFFSAFNLLQSQDLSNFNMVANYTLINTYADDTGNYGDLIVTNAPFQGADGVFSFGGYVFDIINEDSTYIQTPKFPNLNDDKFAIQVEFKMDTIRPGKPILVVGLGWRYLGATMNNDGTLQILVNGANYSSNSPVLTTDTWYTLTIIHNEGVSELYVDDQLAVTRSEVLNHPSIDTEMSNSHTGNGTAFRGYWRNLKVFEEGSVSANQLDQDNSIAVFPNPVCSEVFFQSEKTVSRCTLWDMNGRLVLDNKVTGTSMSAGELDQGTYFMRLIAENGAVEYSKLVKACR